MRAAEKCFDGTREEILKQFADWLCREYPLPREQQLAFELAEHTRSTVTVVYGDPYEVFVEENGIGGLSEVEAWRVSDPNYSFLFTLDYERRKKPPPLHDRLVSSTANRAKVILGIFP